MILTLLLGIGSVGAMFTVVYGVLLAPLPYAEPDRLVGVGLQVADQPLSQAPGFYSTYERTARSLDDVGLYKAGTANVRTSSESDDVENVATSWVTASTMRLLRVRPLLGRWFTSEEEVRGGPNVAIIGESEWRSRFGSAVDIVGKTLIVNDAPRVIVGVMPEHFAFPTAAIRIWLPIKENDDGSVGSFSYAGVARLAPGVTAAQAQAELGSLLPRVAELYPRLQSGGSTARWLEDMKPMPVVLPLRDELVDRIAQTLWLLAAAAGLVLLVAWANASNLMLARADASLLEVGVRQALGASRLRIATHFLGESTLLGAISAVLALMASYGAVRALVVFGPADVPRLEELEIGLTTVSLIALVAIVGMIICMAVPAARLLQGGMHRNLQDGTRGHSTGKARQRLRTAISALQIAVALAVSIWSALLFRTALQIYQTQPGFDAAEVTTARILLPLARYRDSSTVAFYARLAEQTAQVPSVRSVGLVAQLPLGGGHTLQQDFQIEGRRAPVSLPVNIVGNGYFGAMRIPVIAGRDFRPLESEQSRDIIISRSAAGILFGDGNGTAAIGKSLMLAPNGPAYTVVGVVGDVRNRDLTIPASAMLYRPQIVPLDPDAEPGPRPSMVLVVRSSGSSGEIVSAIRKIVRGLDPAVPIFDVRSMDDVVRASTARLSLSLALITVAAAVTSLLGGIGLYALMSYMVSLRTREFGVRIALGADPGRITRLVVVRGLVLTVCGVGVGFALHASAAPFFRAFLYGVKVTDPLALAVATLMIVATAAVAIWIPAKRAASIDPAEALRSE
ncbi:ADOP family duplicated permease [Lysobacter sp. TLK-CK17T]|uniref:ADOP family duplicated permease n=2 Tax=Marilutibacter chinensis TaxID=2912247 RepID=A0ABS9HZY6_9GAMM|nr:ADOP family duplicated permease [Lysobacter chinensis]